MKGFFSYAHDDHAEFVRLRTHLKAAERACGVDIWADKRIKGGDYWSATIKDAIDAASFHVLLLSPAFFASDYIFDHELPAIAAKHRTGDLVLPIVAKRCMWEPFVSALQAMPLTDMGKLQPIHEWRPQDNGYHAASKQLLAALTAHLGGGQQPGFFGGSV